ncbi:shieldin complex subunit 3 [Nerophis ophidion]|uniref:shieldin complex subunit 3 n=1 Tax=Nerophis ophidion TaxID=159077 RepID=UPI002ADFC4DC|nr:shieldin complex subunit 3 [Nerophis ophidion]
MEDVVLHVHGRVEGLCTFIETTEKLLEPFTCRPPPVFAPWFSDTAAKIRPAKRPPVLSGGHHEQSPADVCGPGDQAAAARESTNTTTNTTTTNTTTNTTTDSPKRSWSVLASRGAVQNSPSLSNRFRGSVALHGLHPQQRSKWVISQHNCGPQDLEQVWRAVQRCSLATANANIQRQRAEIWVFCDLLHSEQVGRVLKERLELAGTIGLFVHRRGRVFSL